MPPLPPDVLHALPLIAALFFPTVFAVKYGVQFTKDYLGNPSANATRLYALGIGAAIMVGLATFFAHVPTPQVAGVEAVCGAAAGGAAIGDYHLMDILRGFGIPLPSPTPPTK